MEVVRFGEKDEGIKSVQTALYKDSHSNVKCSVGNVVNNIVTTLYTARWVLDLCGADRFSYTNVYSLCYIPETNVL